MLLTTEQIVKDPSNLALLLSKGHEPIDNGMAASILKNPYVMAAIVIAVDKALAEREGSPGG